MNPSPPPPAPRTALFLPLPSPGLPSPLPAPSAAAGTQVAPRNPAAHSRASGANSGSLAHPLQRQPAQQEEAQRRRHSRTYPGAFARPALSSLLSAGIRCASSRRPLAHSPARPPAGGSRTLPASVSRLLASIRRSSKKVLEHQPGAMPSSPGVGGREPPAAQSNRGRFQGLDGGAPPANNWCSLLVRLQFGSGYTEGRGRGRGRQEGGELGGEQGRLIVVLFLAVAVARREKPWALSDVLPVVSSTRDV